MAVIRNIATKQGAGGRRPSNAIGNIRKSSASFDIKRAANKRLAAGGRRGPSNAIGNIRQRRM